MSTTIDPLWPAGGQYQPGRVLDHLGRPWQQAEGYQVGPPIPHVLTFASILSSGWKVYYAEKFDEAMRNDRNYAMYMKNDCGVTGLLNERKLGTASLKWHVDVDNEKDPAQKAIRDGLTSTIKMSRHFQTMLMYLLETIWYGRYGAQVWYEPREVMLPDIRNPDARTLRKAFRLCHNPVNGDKIRYLWDGTPCIKVNSSNATRIPKSLIVRATDGWAVALKGTWRRNFIIHQHEIVDADFWAHEASDSIHGVGVRSFIHWMHWLKSEWLGNIADWCARTGLGVRVWYYQGGNPTSRREVEEAAKLQTDRTNLLVPRYPAQGGRPVEGVEFVDTTGTGADLLLKLQKHIDETIERYMIGQTLSSGTEGSGLGGSGVADLHANTKSKIIAFDATNLQETLTEDFVRPLAIWMYGKDVPEVRDIPISFVFEIDSADPQKKMQSVKDAASLGVTFRMTDVRGITGFEAPQPGDEQVGGQQQQPGMPGGPGQQMPPGMEDLADDGRPPDEDLDQQAGQLFGGGDEEGGDEQQGQGQGQGQWMVQPASNGEPSRNARNGEPERYAWDRSKHPRGQPGNPGQFGPSGNRAWATSRDYGTAAAAHLNRHIDRIHRDVLGGRDHGAARLDAGTRAAHYVKHTRASAARAWRDVEQAVLSEHGDTPAARSLLDARKAQVIDDLATIEEAAQSRIGQPFTQQHRRDRDGAREDVVQAVHRIHDLIDHTADFVKRYIEGETRSHEIDEARAFAEHLTQHGPMGNEDELARLQHPNRWATLRRDPSSDAWEIHTPSEAFNGGHYRLRMGGGLQLTDNDTKMPTTPAVLEAKRRQRDEPRRYAFDPNEPRDDSGKWTKDGNGGGSTTEQDTPESDWKKNHIRSRSFKAWFGDWESDPENASKVVNKDGDPQDTYGAKPVYNGNHGNFNAFDPQKIGAHGTYAGAGFYFAENEEVAQQYAQGGGRIITAYLNIRKPFDFDAKIGIEQLKDWSSKISKETSRKWPNWIEEDIKSNLRSAFGRVMDNGVATGAGAHKAICQVVGEMEANNFLSFLGYDGICHRSSDLAGTPRVRDSQKDYGRVWVAFSPTQIKGTDNVGTFDLNNPDIRYATTEISTEIVRYEAAHAPKGGVTVRGKRYTGGEFIPAGEMAKASSEERAAVHGDPHEVMKATPERHDLPESHGHYFNTDKAHATVDLAKLKSTRARPEGIANANRFMHGALMGKIGRRDPIKVVDNKDGTYTVADGNSTYANAARAGWKSLPVQFVDHTFLQAEQAKTLKKENARAAELLSSEKFFADDERSLPEATQGAYSTRDAIYGAAAERKLDFDLLMNMGVGVSRRLDATAVHLRGKEDVERALALPGTTVLVGGIKGEKRAREVVDSWYDGDWSKLHDIIRATVATESVHDLPKAMQAVRDELAAKGWRLAKRPRNKFEQPTPAGYRDMNLTFITDDGLTGEIQLNTKPMMRAKEYGGHVLYETIRTIEAAAFKEQRDMTPDEAATIERMNGLSNRLYDTAWQVSLGLQTNEDLDREIREVLAEAKGPAKYSRDAAGHEHRRRGDIG